MKIADFFATLGFKVDDAGLKQVRDKIKEATSGLKNSSRQQMADISAIDKAHAAAIKEDYMRKKANIDRLNKAHEQAYKEDIRRTAKKYKEEKRLADTARTRTYREQQAAIAHQRRVELTQMRSQRTGQRSLGMGAGIGLGAGLRQVAGSAAAGFGVFELGRSMFDAAQMKAKTLAALTATTGGKENALKEYQFLNNEVDRLSMNLDAASASFINLKGSAMGSKLVAEDVNKIFSSTSELLTVYGASADQVKLSFRALGQMMNKEQIMAEELKNQLGEHLYGAIALTADALGMDVPTLLKEMEKGSLRASEALTLMADKFHEVAVQGGALGEAIKSPQARLNAMQTKWTRLMISFAESGAMDLLINIFDALGKAMSMVTPYLPAIASGFATIWAIGVDVATVISGLVGALNDISSGLGSATIAVGAMLAVWGWVPLAIGAAIFAISELILLLTGSENIMQKWASQDGPLGAFATGFVIVSQIIGGVIDTLLVLVKTITSVLSLDFTALDVAWQNWAKSVDQREASMVAAWNNTQFSSPGMIAKPAYQQSYPGQTQQQTQKVAVEVNIGDEAKMKGFVAKTVDERVFNMVDFSKASLPGGR